MGHILPPFVILEGKNCNQGLTEGEVPGTKYGTSPKGWIDTELFKHWLLTTFSAMLLEPSHCYFLWMAIAVITSLRLYNLLGKMML